MKSKLFILLIHLTVLCSACSDDGLTPNTGPKVDDQTIVKPFSNIPKLDEMVVYEVNMRAFSGSGTFDGITAQMDHIESLGTNVIWLMPIFPVGIKNGINSPYAVKDYEAVSSEYGTLNDLIELVNEAHSRNIAVILDWVANHTSWDNAWIDNKDWYAQDANGNIIAPPGTGWTDVAELNFDNADMKTAMIKALKYWVENAGIDGYRCDAIDYVPSSFWSTAIPQVNSSSEKDLIWLGEGGKAENFTAGFEFNYGWDFYGKIKNIYSQGHSAFDIFTTNTQEFNSVPNGKSKLRYITNHDVFAWDETTTEVYGQQGSVGAFVATAFMDGIPLIYNGQEVANPEKISFFGKNPIDWTQNPDVLKQYQDVMTVRTENIKIVNGKLTSYSNTDAIIFDKNSTTGQILVIVNTRNASKNISLPAIFQNTTWTNTITNENVELGTQLSLGVYEYLILKK